MILTRCLLKKKKKKKLTNNDTILIKTTLRGPTERDISINGILFVPRNIIKLLHLSYTLTWHNGNL